MIKWLFQTNWEKRRKHDLGPYYQSQIDELRRLYPKDADEIILREHKRLGPHFSSALNMEAKRAIIKRLSSQKNFRQAAE